MKRLHFFLDKQKTALYSRQTWGEVEESGGLYKCPCLGEDITIPLMKREG